MAFINRCCFMSLQKGSVLSAVYVLFVYTITFLSDAVHLSTFGELSAQENHRKWMAMPSWIQMLREFQCECVDFECFGFDPLDSKVWNAFILLLILNRSKSFVACLGMACGNAEFTSLLFLVEILNGVHQEPPVSRCSKGCQPPESWKLSN